MKSLLASILLIYAPIGFTYANLQTESLIKINPNQAASAENGQEEAQSEDPAAQYTYGMIQYQKKNYKEAAIWWLKAANQDHENAQYQLGKMFVEGQGIPQDNAKAYFFFCLSADKGFAEAIKAKATLEKTMSQEQLQAAKDWYERYTGKK